MKPDIVEFKVSVRRMGPRVLETHFQCFVQEEELEHGLRWLRCDSPLKLVNIVMLLPDPGPVLPWVTSLSFWRTRGLVFFHSLFPGANTLSGGLGKGMVLLPIQRAGNALEVTRRWTWFFKSPVRNGS